MRIAGVRKNNCRFDAPGYGVFEVSIVTLGYGLLVSAQIGESRHQRTFYPYVKTPGMWYIEAAFSSVEERNEFHRWLRTYIMLITDQWEPGTLAPIAVIVPSHSFIRTGYPTSSIQFGDAMGIGVYRSVVQFASAVNPTVANYINGSQYAPPLRDATANKFYPADEQAHTLPAPIYPSSRFGVDAVWKTNPGDPKPPRQIIGGGGKKP